MGDIGKTKRVIIAEPIPDDIPRQEPSPEAAPAEAEPAMIPA